LCSIHGAQGISVFGSASAKKAVDEGIITGLRAMAKGMHGYWQQFTKTAFQVVSMSNILIHSAIHTFLIARTSGVGTDFHRALRA